MGFRIFSRNCGRCPLDFLRCHGDLLSHYATTNSRITLSLDPPFLRVVEAPSTRRLACFSWKEPTSHRRKHRPRRQSLKRRRKALQRSSQFQESHPIVLLLACLIAVTNIFSEPDSRSINKML